MRPYRTVFNRRALEFVADADDDTYVEIESWINRIERAPSSLGDYTEQDEDRRDLQIVVLKKVAITYRPDHAAQEVRVVRIEANRDS